MDSLVMMPASGRSLLVVDDDDAIRVSLCDLLRDEGYAVRWVANGQEALAAIAEARPDAILLDLMMPIMDGWQALEELSRLDPPAPPVIVLSANPSAPTSPLVVGHLRKPFAVEDLLRLLTETLG